MILSRDKIRQAFARALALGPDEEAAIAAVAEALGVDAALVRAALEPVEDVA